MSLQNPRSDSSTATSAALKEVQGLSLPENVAAPILAGMRARAVADACERLALPAVLIDGRGKVLHVGRLAGPYLQGEIGLVANHLVGRTVAARRAVQVAVSDALGGGLPRRRGGRLHGLAYHEASPVQRLRGVVLIGRQDRAARKRMAALRGLLDAAGGSTAEGA